MTVYTLHNGGAARCGALHAGTKHAGSGQDVNGGGLKVAVPWRLPVS